MSTKLTFAKTMTQDEIALAQKAIEWFHGLTWHDRRIDSDMVAVRGESRLMRVDVSRRIDKPYTGLAGWRCECRVTILRDASSLQLDSAGGRSPREACRNAARKIADLVYVLERDVMINID